MITSFDIPDSLRGMMPCRRPGGRQMTLNALTCARVVLRLALCSVLVNVLGWSQTITSTIIGQVNDPTGAGVAEAKVSTKNAETGMTMEGLSDSSGAYSIPQLQPGI